MLAYQLKDVLLQHNRTICTAESCTGGLIAHLITNVAGSSAYLMGGVVAYSNEIKEQILGVDVQILIDHGAVSEQTAKAMAQGARNLLKTDYALSVTGVAGPGGGTDEKPVGLTYIGLAGPGDLLIVQRHVWAGTREENKVASADAALQLAINHIA